MDVRVTSRTVVPASLVARTCDDDILIPGLGTSLDGRLSMTSPGLTRMLSARERRSCEDAPPARCRP